MYRTRMYSLYRSLYLSFYLLSLPPSLFLFLSLSFPVCAKRGFGVPCDCNISQLCIMHGILSLARSVQSILCIQWMSTGPDLARFHCVCCDRLSENIRFANAGSNIRIISVQTYGIYAKINYARFPMIIKTNGDFNVCGSYRILIFSFLLFLLIN